MPSRDLDTLQLRGLVAEGAEFFPITVDVYHELIANGSLPEGAPYELIGGHIVRKDRSEAGKGIMTIGHAHVLTVKRLAKLGPHFEKLGCHIQTQQPIAIPPRSEPEPDAAVVLGDEEIYAGRIVPSTEVLCVIEVSDNSVGRDHEVKLPMYAKARIPCYMVFNLAERKIEVFTNPGVDRKRKPIYQRSLEVGAGMKLDVPAAGGAFVTVEVDKLLP